MRGRWRQCEIGQSPDSIFDKKRSGYMIEYPSDTRDRIVRKLGIVFWVVWIETGDMEMAAFNCHGLFGRPATVEQ